MDAAARNVMMFRAQLRAALRSERRPIARVRLAIALECVELAARGEAATLDHTETFMHWFTGKDLNAAVLEGHRPDAC